MTSRKDEVKQSRKDLKELGFEKFFISPLKEYWKKNPLHAFFNFSLWVLISYTVFTGLQAINNDMIYCDCSNDGYDGKLMEVYNDYVNYVNTASKSLKPPMGAPEYEYEMWIRDQEILTSTIVCNYDLKRWFSEPIGNNLKSIGKGWFKVMFKQK